MRAVLKLGWGVKEKRRIGGLEGEDGKGVVFSGQDHCVESVINYLKYKIYGQLINSVGAELVGKSAIIIFFPNKSVSVPQSQPTTLYLAPHWNIFEIVIGRCRAQYRIVQIGEMQLHFETQWAFSVGQQRLLLRPAEILSCLRGSQLAQHEGGILQPPVRWPRLHLPINRRSLILHAVRAAALQVNLPPERIPPESGIGVHQSQLGQQAVAQGSVVGVEAERS